MAVKIASSGRGAKARAGARDVEALIRKLVAHAEHAAPATTPAARPAPADDDAERVLIDCEVDGIRCLLARSQPSGSEQSFSLSPREQEVARMIAKGYPNKIIASVLEISVWTVATHLRRIFAKLGVTSRAAMVTTLIRHGKI